MCERGCVCAKVRPSKVCVCICVCVAYCVLIYSRSCFPLTDVFSQFSLSLILTDTVQLVPDYKKKTFLSRLLFKNKTKKMMETSSGMKKRDFSVFKSPGEEKS